MEEFYQKIYLFRANRVPPIKIARNSQLQITVETMDYNIPEGSRASAFAKGAFSGAVYTQECTISGNRITFTPASGFFVPGRNSLQYEINDGIIPLAIDVHCELSLPDGGEATTPEEILPYVTRAESAANGAEQWAGNVETWAGSAESWATNAQTYAGYAGNHAETAGNAASESQAASADAAGAAAAAAGSASAALESKNVAAASAAAAAGSATAAGESAAAAAGSASAALDAATDADGARDEAVQAAARAEEVKYSIPEDYKELSDGVNQLKDDLAEIDTIISPFLPVPAHIGVNKCDPSNFSDGWIDANGNWTDTSGMLTTDYIDISGFSSGFLSAYCCLKSGVPYNNLGMFSCCFFSGTDGSVVPGGNRGAHNSIDTCAIAIPDGANYARVSFNTAGIISSYMIIDQHVTGSADAPNYTPFQVIPATDGEKIASENDVFCWKGKTWLSYGDSITAIGNGNPADAWQQYVTDRLKFGTQIVRGIGGSTYKYKVIPAFINADGSFHSRADGASMLDPSSYTAPEGTTAHWSYMASWDRITAMIPDDIKDSIDLIFTFGVNDSGWIESTTFDPPVFSAENDTDAEWMAAEENTLGGDYDVNTFIGAWASCIMKLQKRCPNALIVCGTGWSGRGSTDNTDSGDYNVSSQNVWKEGRLVQQIANYFSVPCIDIWGNTQVNPWNRSLYNADVIHPYKDAGKKALARVVIDGLAQIHPRMDVE